MGAAAANLFWSMRFACMESMVIPREKITVFGYGK